MLGTLLVVVGVIFRNAPKKVVYDLPVLIAFIGVAVMIYGGVQFLRRKALGETVAFSLKKTLAFFLDNAIIFALLVLVVVICILNPNFMQIRVVLDILTQSSPRLVIALGICFALIIGGTDLSAGRMVGMAAVVTTSMLQTAEYGNRFFPNLGHMNIILPILIAIFACMLFGMINGFLVAKFNMHPFIATLAVQVIVYGVCSLYFDMSPNNSQPIGGVRPDFIFLGQHKIAFPGFSNFLNNFFNTKFNGLSILIPIAGVIALAIWFVLNKTVFGKNVYAIGGNKEAAIVSGVNVFVTIMFVFIVGAAMYGVGGVLEAARTAGATNNYGVGYELDAIAACVVGGVSLNGGVGKVSGIITGVLVFTVIQYGLQFINVSPMWQQVIKGVIIAVAVAIDLSKYNKK
ncbi:MAG: beta-methylgalactoside transporter permease [Clostridiales bacterium]|nr:beta-methylgalactoside transporter permease [Clostridiales bacterium]